MEPNTYSIETDFGGKSQIDSILRADVIHDLATLVVGGPPTLNDASAIKANNQCAELSR